MDKILAIGTHATDDPTKATLPFLAAQSAIAAHKDVTLLLVAEAAYLAKPTVAANVHGVGFPPLTDLIRLVVEAAVPVYV